jgi:hypothetical protein
MSGKTNNVFISHIHEDDVDLGAMKSLLARNGFSIKDSSINSARPNNATSEQYIKGEILAPRIRWAGTMVVLISPGTRDSKWVNWEIEYAQRMGKRIVGVWEHGAAECDAPEALDRYADAVVGWQSERIEGAICGKIDNWQNSDGQLRGGRNIARFTC